MYEPTIGLEIHIGLKTKTKMFCSCLNDFDEKHPNINICPICLGHPGTLPTINKKAVESVLKLGLALNAEIGNPPAGGSKFDRKNYFYPDLPKGYQISQYDKPLALGGALKFRIQNAECRIKIRRIHLEEDAARLVHSPDGKSSLVDFNRAGVPLTELVTEPDIKSGEEAVAFARELQLVLRYLEVSDADMEKGQMRVEANISLSDKRQAVSGNKLGVKVEIKNLNSFKAVQEAIDYEIKRQAELLEKGEKIKHETRGWDEFEKKTKHQRLKEESHDYRYFPEPDLPVLDLTAFNLEKLKVEIPELPVQKRSRFSEEYGLLPNQAEILVEDRELAQYFEEAASELKSKLPIADYQILFNYLSSDLKGLINEQKITIKESNIAPENFADLTVLIIKGEISSRLAKDVLKEMFLTGLAPRRIIQEKGLIKISDDVLINQIIEEVINENFKAIEDYKKGRGNAIQFLIGQAMRKLKGRAEPKNLETLLKSKIKSL